MPSEAELELRPWRPEDADEVGVTPASPEIGELFGTPFDGFATEPDPEALGYAIVENGNAVGRIWLVRDRAPHPLVLCTHPRNERSQRVAERAGFRRDGVVERYARFEDGETTALRFVFP